jgi:CheY-like chemotaxis protein
MTAIAIVEDNADNRLLLRALLEATYTLTEYETGIAALAGLLGAMPDLVLLDISLPGMDGLEVLARIRSNASLQHLPVIAFTAHAMAGDREKYLAAGFDDYVTKPIVDEALLFGAIARLATLAARPRPASQ